MQIITKNLWLRASFLRYFEFILFIPSVKQAFIFYPEFISESAQWVGENFHQLICLAQSSTPVRC